MRNAGKLENSDMRNEAPSLIDGTLTSQIIESAIDVHRSLGPGFLEALYEEALCIELEQRGIVFDRQKSVLVRYKGRCIGEHRLDLLVEDKIVVELKSVQALEPIHFSVVGAYLKALDVHVAPLLNFASMHLPIKRVRREPGHGHDSPSL